VSKERTFVDSRLKEGDSVEPMQACVGQMTEEPDDLRAIYAARFFLGLK
jgi:hypothetical protein